MEVKIKRNWSPGGKEGFKKAINEVRKDKHLRTSLRWKDKEERYDELERKYNIKKKGTRAVIEELKQRLHEKSSKAE